ncbi:MAG: hypothetical protein SH817_04180 [Leptospira sp.]|nr:hypothetical protein [Leptospira sp.]
MQNSNTYNARKQILRDIFFSPKSAFESYYQKTDLGNRDLFMIHLSLALLGGLMKFVGNLIQIFVFKVTSLDEETNISLFQGIIPIIGFYVLVYGLLRLTDSFRMYHQMRDKAMDWSGPEPHVFIISFLPFTSTSVFWILPPPFPLLLLGLGFLYSLQLAYMYLSIQRMWTSRDFFFLLMKVTLFFLVLISVPLFFYHILRTVLN